MAMNHLSMSPSEPHTGSHRTRLSFARRVRVTMRTFAHALAGDVLIVIVEAATRHVNPTLTVVSG